MKTCKTCNIEKSIEEFEAHRRACKKCRAAARRPMFEVRRETLRDLVQKAKSVPCADCKQSFPLVCMDFDHLPGHEKLFTISGAVSQARSFDAMVAEIAKCEVVRANCHRIRTAARRMVGAENESK